MSTKRASYRDLSERWSDLSGGGIDWLIGETYTLNDMKELDSTIPTFDSTGSGTSSFDFRSIRQCYIGESNPTGLRFPTWKSGTANYNNTGYANNQLVSDEFVDVLGVTTRFLAAGPDHHTSGRTYAIEVSISDTSNNLLCTGYIPLNSNTRHYCIIAMPYRLGSIKILPGSGGTLNTSTGSFTSDPRFSAYWCTNNSCLRPGYPIELELYFNEVREDNVQLNAITN